MRSSSGAPPSRSVRIRPLRAGCKGVRPLAGTDSEPGALQRAHYRRPRCRGTVGVHRPQKWTTIMSSHTAGSPVTEVSPPPDVAADRALKEAHRRVWASGDYSTLASELIWGLGPV